MQDQFVEIFRRYISYQVRRARLSRIPTSHRFILSCLPSGSSIVWVASSHFASQSKRDKSMRT
jgi:hypothetical protein